MKKYIITIILIYVSSYLFAQNKAAISGIVIDEATQKPIEFVNVSLLLSQAKDSLIQGSVTNTQGAFSLENIASGNYTLKVSFIGYQEQTQNIKILPNRGVYKLPKIALAIDSKMLNDVEVVGQGSQMKFEIDKKVFMVDQSLLSAGAGTTEILQTIPSVNVDNDGNISLRNNGNVQVWINGKPSGLTTDNRGEILEQLPAESVESVEIITNPSAKYNPEGSVGIINIVLKKDRKAGYYGNVSAGISYPFGTNIGVNLNYSNKKIDGYINLSYRKREEERGGYNNRTSFGNDIDTTYLNQTNSGINAMQGVFLRTGINYHINANNSIGLSGFTMYGNRGSDTEYDYTQMGQDKIVEDTYSQYSIFDRDIKGYNLNLDYKHAFKKKGHELTGAINYNSFVFDANNDYTFDRINIYSYRKQEANKNANNISVQADYVLPINEQSKFEAGYKSSFSTDHSLLSSGNINTGVLIPDYKDDFTFDREIHAAYATYQNKLKSLGIGYQIGLRGEQTITDWKNIDSTGYHSEFDFFPSIFLTKKINDKNEIQLSATRRINRPDGRRINPFRNISDSTNIVFGNPDLKPEFALAYELNYIKSWKKHSLASSIYFRQTNNVIQYISTLVQPVNAKEYMETTYKNITSSRNGGLEFTAKDRLFSLLELTSMLSLYYSKMDGNNAYQTDTKENFSWNMKIIGNLLFKKGFSSQITANYKAPDIIAQGKSLQGYSIDLGLKKTFNKKINANLSIKDILNSRKQKSETYGNNFYQESENYRQGRSIMLTVSYNFGNMKSKNNKQKPDANLNQFDEM